MSGICGIWASRAASAGLSRRVQAGLNAMQHRGRDGMSIYPAAQAALGHCLFDTGCNGMLVDEDGFAIAFDGRIDNRDGLASAASIDGADRFSDAALLLQAYRKLGAALPAKLRGDFAIAILDPARSALFVCRDQLGIKPLFYCKTPDAIYLASEIKGLKAMAAGTRFTVRDAAMDGYVTGSLDSGPPECTFYEEVLRLLPGHCAFVSERGIEVSRYWELNPGLPQSRRDGPAQLRRLLTQAINRRLRSTATVGALLSGGLDSSSIVSLIGAGQTDAAPSDVKIASMVFTAEGGRDETPYIDAVLDAYDLDHLKIDSSGATAFQGCDEIVAEQDHPIPAPNIATFRQFLRKVPVMSGARVILHGHGGDEVISHGRGIFQELAESGRWMRLWRMLGEDRELREMRAAAFFKLVRGKGLTIWRRKLARLVRPGRPRADIPVRYTSEGWPRPFEQALQLRTLNARLYAIAMEGIDHNAAAAGVEIRMPFLDVDLVEFCVTVPALEKRAGTLSRMNLRQALDGILPPAIAARPDKFEFTERMKLSILTGHAALVEDVLRDSGGRLAPFADLPDLRKSWRGLRETGSLGGGDFQRLWRAVMLSRWLSTQQSRPAVRAEKVAVEA